MVEVDLLLVHPWIYDFSAFDFWLKPYGLLKLGGLLRHLGYSLHYLDLVDPFHPDLPRPPKRKPFGTGHFYREVFPKPSSLLDVPRRYFRYGLPYDLALRELQKVKPKLILTSTTMTYWYPGLFLLLKTLRSLFPEIPILVGGLYARLAKEHLEDFLTKERLEGIQIVTDYERAIELVKALVQPSGKPHPTDYPIFDRQRKIPYIILLTSKGCPYHCPYCASKTLYPTFERQSPEKVLEEIKYWYFHFKVEDFAFYDDALLYNFSSHLKHILERVIDLRLKIRFHTPNALHARFLNEEVATLLKMANFTTIRLGLERIDNRFDAKVSKEEFVGAVRALKKAGFKKENLGAYVIFGIPDEDFKGVERTLKFLHQLEINPYLAEFSPVPGTKFFELCQKTSRYPLKEDPIFHNKSIFPALPNPDWHLIQSIKDLAKRIRRDLGSPPSISLSIS